MSITRAVVEDLLPVYLTGEASEDTRRLVEEYLAAHPDLADTVRAAREVRVPLVSPPADLEHRALARTRALLGRRNFLLGLGFLFTYLPLGLWFEKGTVTLLIFRDQPALAAVSLVVALITWIAFLYTCRQVQATGLRPSSNWKIRFLWMFGGYFVGVPLRIVFAAWWGMNLLIALVPITLSGIALIGGEKLGQIGPAKTWTWLRPITLFGKPEDEDED